MPPCLCRLPSFGMPSRQTSVFILYILIKHCLTYEAFLRLSRFFPSCLCNIWYIPILPLSSYLAWRIPGTAEPGGLLSMGSQSQSRLKRLSSSSSANVCVLTCLQNILSKLLESINCIAPIRLPRTEQDLSKCLLNK